MKFVKNFIDNLEFNGAAFAGLNRAFDRSSLARYGRYDNPPGTPIVRYPFSLTQTSVIQRVANDPLNVIFYGINDNTFDTLSGFILDLESLSSDLWMSEQIGNLNRNCIYDSFLKIIHVLAENLEIDEDVVRFIVRFALGVIAPQHIQFNIIAAWRNSDVFRLPANAEIILPASVTMPLPPHLETRFPGGRVERTKLGRAKPLQFSLSFQAQSDGSFSGDAVYQMVDFFDTEDVFYVDFENDACQRYFVRRTGDLNLSIVNPRSRTVDFGQINFEVAA